MVTRIVSVGDDFVLPAAVMGPLNDTFALKNEVGSAAVEELRWFRNQVGGVASAPVDVLFVGDSTMEGARATTRATRWIDQVVAKLRAKYQPAGVAGGVGYTPAVYTGGVPFAAAQWSYLSALGPSTVYNDLFNRTGELNGTTPNTGAPWQVATGVYTMDGSAVVVGTANGINGYAPVGTAADREVTLNGQFGTTTATNTYFNLVCFYDFASPNNKVQLEAVVSTTNSTWRIVKKIAGVTVTMASYATPPVPVDVSGATFTAKIKVEGLTVTATVNGNVLTATLTQGDKDALAAATATGFSMPVIGSKVLDYSVATLGAAEVTVVPTLDGGYGLGLRAVRLGPTGTVGVMRRTFTGTAVDVIVTKRSGGGTVAVTIDGVAKTAIDTNNASEINGHATRYGSLAQGSHVLELSCASGYAILEGVMEYNQDENAGIRMWDASHAGYNTGSYTAITKWANTVDAVMTPDLAVIALGLNDYAAQAGITPTAFKTNLLAIIAKVREANPFVSVVLHNSWERGDLVAPTYPWADYAAKIDEIVEADPTILLVDTNGRLLGWNLVDPAFRNVWDADKIHLSPAGYGAVANAITAGISD